MPEAVGVPSDTIGRPSPDSRAQRRALAISLLLALVTFVVFGRMVVNRHDFLQYDDQLYVFENPFVPGGLTWSGVQHAFTDLVAANWHPVTMLSHMLDVSLFGLENPWGHHLVSLLLHAANAVLLFLWLRRVTQADWPSALVAALFAWHPLHVESVAWVSERKDVLSTFFWLLTMWVYVDYVAAPSIGRYLVMFGLLVLGLLSKPMVVTLPFVLLLVDYWPLNRFPAREVNWTEWSRIARRLMLEKVPLFVLVAIFCVVTLRVQTIGKALVPFDAITPSVRLTNVLMSYNQYVAKTLWPYPLAAPYVLAGRFFNIYLAALSVIGLVVVTWLIAMTARTRPYLIMGWLWYLGTLVPVIGFVQVGTQSMADRYSYIPLIGLFVMAAYGLADYVEHRASARRTVVVSTFAVLLVLAVLSFRQVGVWRDTSTLFLHAIAHTRKNHVAHSGYGTALFVEGRYEESLEQFEIAIELVPTYLSAHFNRGIVLAQLGRPEEAEREFLFAKQLGHSAHKCLLNIAKTYLQRKDKDYDRAFEIAQEANRLGSVKAPLFLAMCEEMRGNDLAAISWYEQASKAFPQDPILQSRLILIYAASQDDSARNGARALELAHRLVAQQTELGRSQDPTIHALLAAAYAENGDFKRAVSIANKALRLAEYMVSQGQHDALKLLRSIEEQLREYQQGRPYRKSTDAVVSDEDSLRKQTPFSIE